MEEYELVAIIAAILWSGDKANIVKNSDEYISGYVGDAVNLLHWAREELEAKE